MLALAENLTRQDSEQVSERMDRESPGGLPRLAFLFSSLFISPHPNSPHRGPTPTPTISDLPPSHPDWPSFPRTPCTPDRSPDWGLRRPSPSPCQGGPAGRHLRAIPARRLSLHVEGRVRHLLSMKCGFRDILWKQKRKNHRGPSCKNNHYPLQRALRNFRAESTSLLMKRNSDRNSGRVGLIEGRNGMFALAQQSGGERWGRAQEQHSGPRLCNLTPASSPCFLSKECGLEEPQGWGRTPALRRGPQYPRQRAPTAGSAGHQSGPRASASRRNFPSFL